jgi:bis(5'-nucleosidyl)-tetraphosphatase
VPSANTARRSAGIVVVHCASITFQFLLLRAYRYWDFPKGGIDEGEPPLMAARRETAEETGLSDLEFRWGNDYVETEPYANGKIARYYVAHAASRTVTLGINSTLGRPEHHEYRWLDYAAARELLNARVARVLDWAHDRIGDRC